MSTWPELDVAEKENRRELVLSGNGVRDRFVNTGFPSKLFSLSNLNFLDIHDTCLLLIPDDISKLTNIQTLILRGNQLSTLPNSICSLSKLKTLDVSSNKLKSLPNDISKLNQLSLLLLSLNELETLPDLKKNVNLVSLDLVSNQLTQFPDVCCPEMIHLNDLKLGKNKIETIPTNVNNLIALKHLDLSSNLIKIVPAELSDCTKIKDMNLKGNPLSNKRLLKLVEQDRINTKQVMDFIKLNCPRQQAAVETKPANAKTNKTNVPDAQIAGLCHMLSVLHVKDSTPMVTYDAQVKDVRPFIVCCIVEGVKFTETTFKKFLQIQTKLHDTLCEKRIAGTIATHDLAKVKGNLLYTYDLPANIKIQPLGRNGNTFSGAQLFSQLQAEADALRKEKKRNVYSGIHKYLSLIEGKPVYACLKDSEGQVISLPPLTNSEITKMSPTTTNILVEVTSTKGQNVCRKILDQLLLHLLKLGIGELVTENGATSDSNACYRLKTQQVKVVDADGALKWVYPSRTDLIYDNENISKNFEP